MLYANFWCLLWSLDIAIQLNYNILAHIANYEILIILFIFFRNPMGTQILLQLCIYMMVVFKVLLPLKVQSCSSNADYGWDQDTNVSFPCSRRYLSGSYFEKHDSLLDLDFQVFLANELPLCSCHALPDDINFVPKASILQRHLVGEGSHRHISTFIEFSIQTQSTIELPAHVCQAVLVERLPSGVFADPFELQHLIQRGVFVDAAVFGDTNLELPSALSNRSVVEVHMDISQNIMSGNKKGLEIKIDLPLHARYPPLDKSGYSRVEMGVPDILVRCIAKEKSQNNNCLLITMAEIVDLNTKPVVWRIPSGNYEHSGFVFAITFTSAALSTLLIVYQLFIVQVFVAL
ncbi:phosphatidylinositol-glycan biosynthesis class X-like protein [Thalictrum thalictroides]|uniref:Phosphatidylinositol-glycan biosynthesis class X-like protein n=1 Tax=Thalictrum thalictroides TaxID=46969 RepID=A0A7J6WHR7_THATH|nr:phosphatidylinositol-glycan biosynthesis class X-like protein [Thalictrum thalictroides]